jgi:hypothetical protein
VKELALMIDDLSRLAEADLDNWERGFVKNVVNRTAMDRRMGNRLSLSEAQVEQVDKVWNKHFGRSS